MTNELDSGGSGRAPAALWEPVDVSSWELLQVEQAGTNSVSWLKDPSDGTSWLHKSVTTPLSTGVKQGEDWAEVVATQVGFALGVPCAKTRLCIRNGERGSLSLSVRPPGYDFNEGRVVLQSAGVPGYVPHTEGRRAIDPARPGVKRPGHSLQNIRAALAEVSAPPGFPGPEGLEAFDIFVGFMVLDALIANRDRHEQNWAVLRPQLLGRPDRLAPSYDHGGSLGYNLQDADRERRLEDEALLASWASRGTAYRFEHVRRAPSLVEHAVHAMSIGTPEAATWWSTQLEELDLSRLFEDLEHGIPGMSVAATTFTAKLLTMNRRRLQDAIRIGT